MHEASPHVLSLFLHIPSTSRVANNEKKYYCKLDIAWEAFSLFPLLRIKCRVYQEKKTQRKHPLQKFCFLCFYLFYKIDSFLIQSILIIVYPPTSSPPPLPSRFTPFLSLIRKEQPCKSQQPNKSKQNIIRLSKTIISNLDMAIQQEENNHKNKHKTQRSTCPHSQGYHKNTKRIATIHICISIFRGAGADPCNSLCELICTLFS